MDILRFRLSGKTAFFKKPEVNSYYYFTYGCVHKVALLGIFGAILGLNGYGQRVAKSKEYPEFYEVLKDLHIGIRIVNEQAYIPKKVQIYNNTVGYASKEQGGVLNIKEQWLENPKWDIYLLIDTPIAEQLANQIVGKSTIYTPYLGKNDHLATISDSLIFRAVSTSCNYKRIDSIFETKEAEFYCFEEFSEEVEDLETTTDPTDIYRYEEYLPVALTRELQQYETKNFVATNLWVKSYGKDVYNIDGEEIVFF